MEILLVISGEKVLISDTFSYSTEKNMEETTKKVVLSSHSPIPYMEIGTLRSTVPSGGPEMNHTNNLGEVTEYGHLIAIPIGIIVHKKRNGISNASDVLLVGGVVDVIGVSTVKL